MKNLLYKYKFCKSIFDFGFFSISFFVMSILCCRFPISTDKDDTIEILLPDLTTSITNYDELSLTKYKIEVTNKFGSKVAYTDLSAKSICVNVPQDEISAILIYPISRAENSTEEYFYPLGVVYPFDFASSKSASAHFQNGAYAKIAKYAIQASRDNQNQIQNQLNYFNWQKLKDAINKKEGSILVSAEANSVTGNPSQTEKSTSIGSSNTLVGHDSTVASNNVAGNDLSVDFSASADFSTGAVSTTDIKNASYFIDIEKTAKNILNSKERVTIYYNDFYLITQKSPDTTTQEEGLNFYLSKKNFLVEYIPLIDYCKKNNCIIVKKENLTNYAVLNLSGNFIYIENENFEINDAYMYYPTSSQISNNSQVQ